MKKMIKKYLDSGKTPYKVARVIVDQVCTCTFGLGIDDMPDTYALSNNLEAKEEYIECYEDYSEDVLKNEIKSYINEILIDIKQDILY